MSVFDPHFLILFHKSPLRRTNLLTTIATVPSLRYQINDIIMTLKQDAVAAVGEFFGTLLFIFLALGGVQATLSSDSNSINGPTPPQILGVAFSVGFSLLISVWIFAPISGGVLNPAVLLALILTRNISLVKGGLYLFAELAGATVGAGLLDAVTPGPLLGVNALGREITPFQATVLEAICTSILVLSVLFLAVEKSKTNVLAPIGIGFAVFVANLIATPWTGTGINPARSFGAAAVTGNFTPDHWVFWIAPDDLAPEPISPPVSKGGITPTPLETVEIGK
ncbi:aquaporin-like protein [Jimgerdemannia flammicorona]|uniref:Aquaporin-like protein n=1 Tax=Jimgerdemannia flammicorona TaxID=994334 RepID=A0A433QWU3_9FUNG|nr:aquaporin-like protein [Jimgerdemannia flammicorona]